MQMDAESDRLFDPIKAMLAGKLPPGDTFELIIPANALQGQRKRRQIQKALATWVELKAPTVPRAPYELYFASRPEQPPRIPFKVRLHRFASIVPPGRFMITHLVLDAETAGNRGFAQRVRKNFQN
jgi:hypothetical protein